MEGIPIVAVIASIAIYFMPSFLAGAREHHNGIAIFMLNLLLGWTVIGWAIAMVWACTEVKRPGGQMPPNWSAEHDRARGVDGPSRW